MLRLFLFRASLRFYFRSSCETSTLLHFFAVVFGRRRGYKPWKLRCCEANHSCTSDEIGWTLAAAGASDWTCWWSSCTFGAQQLNEADVCMWDKKIGCQSRRSSVKARIGVAAYVWEQSHRLLHETKCCRLLLELQQVERLAQGKYVAP